MQRYLLVNMKNLINFKIGVIFSLLFFLSQNLFASNFILNDDGLIDPRAAEKINQIGLETQSKLNTNVYIYVKKSLGLPENIDSKIKYDEIKKLENEVLKDMKGSYVLILTSIEDMHINLFQSENLKEIISKDDILDDYIIPLLASKDKNTLFAKVSAAMLNGYAAVSDTIAESRNIKLDSSIGSQGIVSSTIWRVFMYTLIVTGLLAYIYAILKRRK